MTSYKRPASWKGGKIEEAGGYYFWIYQPALWTILVKSGHYLLRDSMTIDHHLIFIIIVETWLKKGWHSWNKSAWMDSLGYYSTYIIYCPFFLTQSFLLCGSSIPRNNKRARPRCEPAVSQPLSVYLSIFGVLLAFTPSIDRLAFVCNLHVLQLPSNTHFVYSIIVSLLYDLYTNMIMDNSGLRYPRICLNIFSQLFCWVLQTLRVIFYHLLANSHRKIELFWWTSWLIPDPGSK